MNNPKFNNLLDKMKEIHDRKNSDYAEDNNPYSNFEFAAYYAKIPVYKVYLVMEAIKTARIHQLQEGKVPKNEPMDDTYLDKATYATIEASHLIKGPGIKEVEADGINVCSLCHTWVRFADIVTTIGTGTADNPYRKVHQICANK